MTRHINEYEIRSDYDQIEDRMIELLAVLRNDPALCQMLVDMIDNNANKV